MRKVFLTAVLFGVVSAPAFAGDPMSTEHHHDAMKPAAVAASPTIDGTVRALDAGKGTITVEHGPIASLGMDAMTMPYYVKDAAMARGLKPGDKIKMSVAVLDGKYTITSLKPVH